MLKTKQGFLWGAVGLSAVIAIAIFVQEEPAQVVLDTPQRPASPQRSVPSTAESPLGTAPPPMMMATEDEAGHGPKFRVDAAGNLVLDEQTRLNIEELVALTEPSKLYDAVREHTKDLPAAAAKRAEELVDKYVHYQAAQRQSYPPGVAPLTEEDALRELEGLHALRVAHFGADVAKAFYGDEERLSREILELMRLEKDQSLTMEEKAERALRLHSQLPTVSALEQKNRETAKQLEHRSTQQDQTPETNE